MNIYLKSGLNIAAAILMGFMGLATANAQCNTWEKYPEGDKKGREKHVIYRDLFKLQKYDEAYPIWEELFKYVQVPVPAKSTHFMDGATMAFHFAKNETDPAKKQAWYDKAVALYDQNAACNGDDATDRAYQGYYMYANQYPDVIKTFKVYEHSWKLAGDNAPSMIITPMVYLAVYCYNNNVEGFDKDFMRKLYERFKKLKDHNIGKGNDVKNYEEGWKQVETYYAPLADQLFGCEFYVEQYKPKFEADPKNYTQDSIILEIIEKKCGKDNEFYKKVWEAYKPHYDQLMAKMWQSKFDTASAYMKILLLREKSQRTGDASVMEEVWKYYPDAIAQEGNFPSNEDRADLAYRYADHVYRAGNFSTARTYCRTASKYRPDWGQPYLLVGIMYASSGPRCSAEGVGFDAQVVIWPAMDEWQKAKSVDPSVTAKANEYIYKYAEFLPTKGDLFQRQLTDGGSYTVGCWIGQSTIIRSAK